MLHSVRSAVRDLPVVSGTFRYIPGIMPDLIHLSIDTLPAVLMTLMSHGYVEREDIHDRLDAFGCPFERDIVDFVLLTFEGDDSQTALWRKSERDVFTSHYPLKSKYD